MIELVKRLTFESENYLISQWVRGTSCLYESKLLRFLSFMNMTVFWDVSSCTHVEVDRRFTGAYCLHHQGDDGGSTHLWNVSHLLCDYMAQYPRRLSSSYSPPWEPEIFLVLCFPYTKCIQWTHKRKVVTVRLGLQVLSVNIHEFRWNLVRDVGWICCPHTFYIPHFTWMQCRNIRALEKALLTCITRYKLVSTQ
jgi:hypothetical protein